MQPFKLKTAPLDGVTLIEAGAGTGKTYTLTGIFLRLIVERGLSIDQILVVTYTKAATEELKSRIRSGLLAARTAFADGGATDDLSAMLLDRVEDRAGALQLIRDAMTDFDRAAIFTIHGFCQRMLQYFAFETGRLFQSELVQNPQPLVQESADDFWRRYISSAPYEFAHFALDSLKGPEQLAQVLNYCRYPDVRLLPDMPKPLLRGIAPFRAAAGAMRHQWRRDKAEIVARLHDPGLNAVSYKKCTPDPKNPGPTPRQRFVAGLAEQMDLWNGRYPLFDKAPRFSRAVLTKATKKGHQPPEHPFFELCEQVLDLQSGIIRQMTDYLRYLKIRLHRQARQIMDRKKRRKNILFFDDLLLQVHQALHHPKTGALTQVVRRQYKAALVDEFQDTDPLQYDIFRRLFDHPGHTLFMIGDPKQAIYSFRGADIYSYLLASDLAHSRFTLTRNWRSTPALIQAVNSLFQGHSRPFAFEKIDFQPAVPAMPESASSEAPLQLWYLTATGGNKPTKPMSQEAALPRIADAVAGEIVQLMSRAHAPLEARQIAVLTRTHRQSQIVKQALAGKQVPAVLHSAGSVFHSEQAREMSLLLSALAAPEDHGRLRAILAGSLFGLSADEFLQGQEHSTPLWQKRWSAFSRDHRAWIRHGFYPMFRNLMAREQIKARILTQPDGERALTNLLHLAELLHQAEVELSLGPDGLIKWLATQRQARDSGSEEQQLRLESDSLAVRIITMHKSKGLQFDVVFCPFTWSGVKVDQKAAVFHDPGQDDSLTLAIGPGIPSAHQDQARKEMLAENLRMLYVALTRAKQQCYMVWGRINQTELSAPAYLLHGSGRFKADETWIARLERKMRNLTDATLIQELESIQKRSGGTVAVGPLPGITPRLYDGQVAAAGALEHRSLTRSITSNWRMASFSSLIAGQQTDETALADRDFSAFQPLEPASAPAQPDGLFGFPKGVRAGLFFHDVLEHWDHTATDPAQRRALVAAKLQAHGFDAHWEKEVDANLVHLARVELKTGSHSFNLSQVPMAQRINEMEFYFPLKAVSPQELKTAFQPHFPEGQVGRIMEGQLDRLVFEPARGLLKGYIDAIVRHQERYYLVDWKSNYLGAHYEDYNEDQLSRTMAADNYFLQYHLYAVALDLLLRQKIAGYDYQRHFGGALYIFLRGVSGNPTGSTGIFHARPDPSLIQSLEKILIESPS